MKEQDIVERLQAGWELANRGTGWYLSSPRMPYQKKEQHLIQDEIVRGMEFDGVIKTVMPYNSIQAELVERKN